MWDVKLSENSEYPDSDEAGPTCTMPAEETGKCKERRNEAKLPISYIVPAAAGRRISSCGGRCDIKPSVHPRLHCR